MTGWINQQVFESVARWLIDKAGLWLIATGVLSQQQEATAAGAVLTLLALAFSIISARTKHIAIKELGGGSVAEGKAIIKDAKANPTGL